MMKALPLLLASILAISAQELMSEWNRPSPPQCDGRNVLLTYRKNFGPSDYVFNISWGDASAPDRANKTLEDGDVVSFGHTYNASGTYPILASAYVPSFQTQINYADTLEIDDTGCSFGDFPPTVSPRPTPSPTPFPTYIVTAAPQAPTVPENSTEERLLYADFLVTTDAANVSDTDQQFIVRITNATSIADARGELNKTTGFKIIAGTIVKVAAPWNFAQWSFYLDPDTVFFNDMFTEVCDASVLYVEEHLDAVGTDFLPNDFWCPWGTRVLAEVAAVSKTAAPTAATAAPTAASTDAPTLTPSTFADFLATANRLDPTDTSQQFVVRITDPDAIAAARGELTKTANFWALSGTVVPGPAPWEPHWGFHLAPGTVALAATVPATCDAAIGFVANNLALVGGSFLPDGVWCPRGSRILQEVTPVDDGGGGGGASGSRSRSVSAPLMVLLSALPLVWFLRL